MEPDRKLHCGFLSLIDELLLISWIESNFITGNEIDEINEAAIQSKKPQMK